MASNRQSRDRILRKRAAKRQHHAAQEAAARAREAAAREAAARKQQPVPLGVPVDTAALAPSNSYGAPDFVARGYYVDVPFRCVDCDKDEVWTATQQKWWYEVAKGYEYSHAKRCRPCRRRVREKRAEARRIHLEGIARKAAKAAPPS